MSTTPAAAAAPPVFNAYSKHGNSVSVSSADRSAQINEVCQQLCQFQPFLQMLQSSKVPLQSAGSIRIYANLTNKIPYLTVEVDNTRHHFSLDPMRVHQTVIQACKFLLDPSAAKPDFTAPARSYAPEEPPSQPLTTENSETPTQQELIPQEPAPAPKRHEQNLSEPTQAPTTFEQVHQRLQTNPPASQKELLDLIKSIFENFKETQIKTAEQHTRQIEFLTEAMMGSNPAFRKVTTSSTPGPNLDEIRRKLKRKLGNFNKTNSPLNTRSPSFLSSSSTSPSSSDSESENENDFFTIAQKLPRYTENKRKTANHSREMRNHTKNKRSTTKPSTQLKYQRPIVPIAINKSSHQANVYTADSNDELSSSSSDSQNPINSTRKNLHRKLNSGQSKPKRKITEKPAINSKKKTYIQNNSSDGEISEKEKYFSFSENESSSNEVNFSSLNKSNKPPESQPVPPPSSPISSAANSPKQSENEENDEKSKIQISESAEKKLTKSQRKNRNRKNKIKPKIK